MKRTALLILAVGISHTILLSQWEYIYFNNIDTLSSPFDGFSFYDIDFINTDTGYVIGGVVGAHWSYGYILRTYNKGVSWEVISHIDADATGYSGCPTQIFHFGDQIFYLQTADVDIEATSGGGLKSNDGGYSWKKESNTGSNFFFLNDTIGFSQSGDTIYHTEDGGISWSMKWSWSHELLSPWKELRSIFAIDTNLAWGVGESGLIMKFYGKKEIELKVSGTTLPLNEVFFSNRNTGWIAGGFINEAEFGSILLKTTDGGESWEDLPPTEILIQDMLFINSDTGWVAGDNGMGHGRILGTEDGGESWEILKRTLYPVWSLHLNDNILWAVGGNAMMLKNENIEYTITEPVKSYNGQEITLECFPNPFRAYMIINYQLPVFGKVEINIYDFTGRKVTTLISAAQPEGSYKLELNANGFKPGIYFCVLNTGKNRHVIKMILLK